MGVTEEAGRVGAAAVESMKSTPLAIALLIVNIGFLSFAGYVLGQVAANAQERNKSQMELIARLAEDLRDCRIVAPKEQRSLLRLPPLPAIPIHNDLGPN